MLRLSPLPSILVLALAAALDLAAQPVPKVLFHVRLIEVDSAASAILLNNSSPNRTSTVSVLRPDLDIFGLFAEVRADGANIHFLAADNVTASSKRAAHVFTGGAVPLALAPTIAPDGGMRVAGVQLAPGQSFWIPAGNIARYSPARSALARFAAEYSADAGTHFLLLITPEIVGLRP